MSNVKTTCAVAIGSPDVEVTLRLPDGHRFVIIMADQPPVLASPKEAGTYKITAKALLRGMPPTCEWPILLLTIPTKHAQAFLAIPAVHTEKLVEQARRIQPSIH